MNSGLHLKYFVVKPRGEDIHAAASRRAIHAYAKVIKPTNPGFAQALTDWASQEGALAYTKEEEAAS